MVVSRRLCLVGLMEMRQESFFKRQWRLLEMWFLTNQKRVQAMISNRTKEEAKTIKVRVRNVLILILDFRPLDHQVKKDMAMLGNQTIGLPAIGLTIPQSQLRGGLAWELILHGWHQSFEPYQLSDARCSGSWLHSVNRIKSWQSTSSRNTRGMMALRRSFAFALSPLCLPTRRQKIVLKVVLFTAQQHLHVDVLERCDVRILLFLSLMINFGMTIELDPNEDKVTCPALGLYSSPAEYSTMGHSVSELASLAYQPKSRERSARPKKHVTFSLSEQRSAYPAPKNWAKMMMNLLFVQTALQFLKTEMSSFWCDLHQEKNRWKKSVNLPLNAEILHRYEE